MKENLFYLIFIATLFLAPLSASIIDGESCGFEKRETGDYSYNPLVPKEIWEQLKPFFLPYNHPVRAKLDKIFKKTRASQSPQVFEQSGFGKVRLREPTNIVIGKHSALRGWLLKVYLDSQPAVCEWCNWLARIHGAAVIKDCVQKHNFGRFFKIPQKWIYPLPLEPYPSDGNCNRKNFILVVEDMDILDHKQNVKAYLKKPTPEMLNALYIVIKEAGLLDSVYIDNIPFTKEGKIAFIDTEHCLKGPIKFGILSQFLSTQMSAYWQSIIEP